MASSTIPSPWPSSQQQHRREEILQSAPPTTDARSERLLAVALGYPDTWHVVRLPVDKNNPNNLIDVIYAGNPARHKNVALWFHHEAAAKAAQEWSNNPKTSGHLLPRKPQFRKNDSVEVLYEGTWFPATIVKCKEYPEDYRYTVHYTEEDSTQDQVEEQHIRPAAPDETAYALAEEMGFPSDWMAVKKGKQKYHFFSPDGWEFPSKKSALKYRDTLLAAAAVEEGDPPWRTDGHELMGQQVQVSNLQKVGLRRQVEVVQTGVVQGWISETDVDKEGEPGYVCEETGKPANLFHVVFDEAPNHPYPKLLIDFQDMEEVEVRRSLLDKSNEEEESTSEPPAKRAKTEVE